MAYCSYSNLSSQCLVDVSSMAFLFLSVLFQGLHLTLAVMTTILDLNRGILLTCSAEMLRASRNNVLTYVEDAVPIMLPYVTKNAIVLIISGDMRRNRMDFVTLNVEMGQH